MHPRAHVTVLFTFFSWIVVSAAPSPSPPSNCTMPSALHTPAARATYGADLARYLLDLHDARAVFDFCGGMMFQLVLSDRLREHLATVKSADDSGPNQPVLHDAGVDKMAKMPGYSQSARADNAVLFHGREVRKVPHAAGGMGFVLQLTYAGEGADADAEGWAAQEMAEYNGWGHDATRKWRNGAELEAAGVVGYVAKFGTDAFGLHHRFFWHLDREGQMWLSAEDGCEGRLFGSAR